MIKDVITLKNCSFIPIPKCGTCSILHAIGKSEGYYKPYRQDTDCWDWGWDWSYHIKRRPCFTVIRDPYSRMISAWKHLFVDTQKWKVRHRKLKSHSWDYFVKWVCEKGPVDHHTQLQTSFLKEGVEVYLLESDFWPKLSARFGWGQLSVKNKSTPTKSLWTREQLELFERAYKKDLDFYYERVPIYKKGMLPTRETWGRCHPVRRKF